MKRIIYTPLSKTNTLTLFVCMLLGFVSMYATAQNADAGKTVKGIVKFSEDNDAAPGVNIYLKGSTAQGTYSDGKGQFEFPSQLKTGDVLLFSFIGRKTAEYIVTDQTVASIEIVMGPEYIEMVEQALVEGDDPSRKPVFAKVFRRARVCR